jgi:uncharacterized membrane protein YqjE
MIDRLSIAAAVAVRHAGAYSDLILSDLEVCSATLRRQIVCAAAATVAAHVALVLMSALLVIVSWDSAYRLWVMAGLIVVFCAIAGAAVWRLRALGAAAPQALQQTAREWAKDRRLLEELLAQRKAAAP